MQLFQLIDPSNWAPPATIAVTVYVYLALDRRLRKLEILLTSHLAWAQARSQELDKDINRIEK